MLKKFALALAAALLALASPAFADITVGGDSGKAPPKKTVALLEVCNSGFQGARRTVTNALTATTCTAGGGAFENSCVCDDGAWRNEAATATLGDADYGDVTVSGGGGTLTVDAGAITLGKMAGNSVDSTKVVDGSLGSGDYGAASVPLAAMAANSVDGTKVVAGSRGTNDYGAASVPLASMGANSVDGTKVVDNSLGPNDVAGLTAADVDSAAKIDSSGAQVIYSALRDAHVDDTDDGNDVDAGEGSIAYGDKVSGTTGGAPIYFARDFNHSGTLTGGVKEAIAHCVDRMAARGCTVVMDSGDYAWTEQVVLPGGIRLVGAGGDHTIMNGTRIEVTAAIVDASANCSGEVNATPDHVDELDPLCAALLIAGQNNWLEGFSLNCAGGGVIRAETCIEIESQDGVDDGGQPAVNSRGTTMVDVTVRGASHANLYIVARDDSSSSQADYVTGYTVRFLATNNGVNLPRFQVFIDQENTSSNWCYNCEFTKARNAVIGIRQGEWYVHGGSGSNGNGTFPVDDTTAHIRICGDALSATDNAFDPDITCTTAQVGGTKRVTFDGYHWEMGGTGAANYGPFLVYDGTNSLNVVVRNTTMFWNAGDGNTVVVINWDGPGKLTIADNVFSGGSTADAGIVRIQCDGCADAADTSRLALSLSNNQIETGEVTWDVHLADDPAIDLEELRCFRDVVRTPTDASDALLGKLDRAFIVTNIDCAITGTTSIPVTVQECNSTAGACGTTEAAITCDADGATIAGGSVDDPNVDGLDWIKVLYGSPSGTPDSATVQVCGFNL
jgi:hypothetical protein